MRCPAVCAAIPLLALGACHAPPRDSSAAARGATTYEFLAARYDGNGDGAIDASEYTRASAAGAATALAQADAHATESALPSPSTKPSDAFTRLDANSDGKLTPEDFPAERWERDLGIRDMPPELREQMHARYDARAVVLAYFRPEATSNDLALTREALAQGFARLDLDASGTLTPAEFARATDERSWSGPGEAWPLLVAAIDTPSGNAAAQQAADGSTAAPKLAASARSTAPNADSAAAHSSTSEAAPNAGVSNADTSNADASNDDLAPRDGLLSLDEMLAYHKQLSTSEGVLRNPPGVDPLAYGGPGRAGDGPPRGTLAPDFELAPPDGGTRTRLSAWRGKKPVALVFGSYT